MIPVIVAIITTGTIYDCFFRADETVYYNHVRQWKSRAGKQKRQCRSFPYRYRSNPWTIGTSVSVAKYMNAPTIDAKKLANNKFPPTRLTIQVRWYYAFMTRTPRRKPDTSMPPSSKGVICFTSETPCWSEPFTGFTFICTCYNWKPCYTTAKAITGSCGNMKVITAVGMATTAIFHALSPNHQQPPQAENHCRYCRKMPFANIIKYQETRSLGRSVPISKNKSATILKNKQRPSIMDVLLQAQAYSLQPLPFLSLHAWIYNAWLRSSYAEKYCTDGSGNAYVHSYYPRSKSYGQNI